MQEFLSLFRFRPECTLQVGVERERFIVDREGWPQPRAEKVLELLPKDERFGYELSACQLEDRVGPVILGELRDRLIQNDEEIQEVLGFLCLQSAFLEVAPETMDITVFNDPTGRYQNIVKSRSENEIRAACRVAATHVHVGMPDIETALRVYNKVIPHWPELCEVIHHSNGERLAIYQQMAPDYVPQPYGSIEEFYRYAQDKGFDKDLRQNWQLIRMTKHGTIEFRMGGATESHNEVIAYAETCHDLCASALKSEAVAA